MEEKRKKIGEFESDQVTFGLNETIFENRMMSEYVPTQLAAKYLGLSENALRIRVCRGQIKAHKFGRSLRFSKSEIAVFLNQFRLKGEPSGNY
jgi:excisionase family DNA binding protein